MGPWRGGGRRRRWLPRRCWVSGAPGSGGRRTGRQCSAVQPRGVSCAAAFSILTPCPPGLAPSLPPPLPPPSCCRTCPHSPALGRHTGPVAPHHAAAAHDDVLQHDLASQRPLGPYQPPRPLPRHEYPAAPARQRVAAAAAAAADAPPVRPGAGPAAAPRHPLDGGLLPASERAAACCLLPAQLRLRSPSWRHPPPTHCPLVVCTALKAFPAELAAHTSLRAVYFGA